MKSRVELKYEPFDPSVILSEFSSELRDEGAVVSFTGRARRMTRDGARVRALVLESYRDVTRASMEAIADDAHAKFAITQSCIVHRVGSIDPDEAIVFVATASLHRRSSFEAADYIMDRLKTEAVLWKREDHDGGSEWIEPTAGDIAKAARWNDIER